MLDVLSNIDNVKYVDAEKCRYIIVEGWAFIEGKMFCDYEVNVNWLHHPFELKRVKRPDVQIATQCPNTFSGFRIKVDLGEEDIESLQVVIRDDSDKKLILALDKLQLMDLKDEMPFVFHVDHFFYDKNNDVGDVYGYALSRNNDPITLRITDESGNNVDFRQDKIRRPDLVKQSIVLEEDVDCGFNLLFEDFDLDHNYFIHFDCGGIRFVRPLSFEDDYPYSPPKNLLTTLKTKGLRGLLERDSLQSAPEKTDYNDWLKRARCSEEELEAQRNFSFDYEPKISIVVATYNTPSKFLTKMIDSVVDQTYPNWELCIADGSDTGIVVNLIRERYHDSRIIVKRLEENLGIAGNMNEAIKMATGRFVALYDHDDFLEPNALYEYVTLINEHGNATIIYSDEDKVNSEGNQFYQPHFKPDFNLDLLRSGNYITHFLMVHSALIGKVGLLDGKYDGAQDYDFILRCIENENARNIYHISKVLYHWRMHESSTAGNPESKLYAYKAGKRALQDHLNRIGLAAEVRQEEHLGNYRVKYLTKDKPKISIIIPNKDNKECLARCIDSLTFRLSYPDYEIIIMENGSTDQTTYDYYYELEKSNPFVKVIYWWDDFNYSAILNAGASKATGEYLLFLHSDTEITTRDCLEEMLGFCQREDVGAVGPRLLFEDGSIYSAGVVLTKNGTPLHCFQGKQSYEHIYHNRVFCAEDYSALSGACLLTPKKTFEEIGGFDPRFKVEYAEIDYCLKLRKKGLLVVYSPFARVLHRGLNSRNTLVGYSNSAKEDKRLLTRIWRGYWSEGDPYYNPSLTETKTDFSLGKPYKNRK